MDWFVIYTKPKWERKVAEQLTNIGISCYCPVMLSERQWSDRKKKVELPLFNSYVFVQLDESKRNDVFKVQGVVRYLFWLGKPAIVKSEEIDIIKKSVDLRDTAEVFVLPFQKGDSIKVPSGAFKNQDAVVCEIAKTHYTLVLESLGCILKVKYN